MKKGFLVLLGWNQRGYYRKGREDKDGKKRPNERGMEPEMLVDERLRS